MDATAPKKLDTSGLKKFAQGARRTLMEQVSAKLDQVLAEGSPARREQPQAVKELEREIGNDGRGQVVERVAYTWFNRFSALRFMDVNGYTTTRVVSPADGQIRPEILSEAAAGQMDQDLPETTRQKVFALLEGRSPSPDPQSESYRLLLVAACNGLHKAMPYLFEKIADYTELLMPTDLLSSDSVLIRIREVMTEDACQDVEIIGWLYQFYISEKKDQVFAALKKNQKISAENIPAATQLFTPHWIVRYLVENSLGRLWLLNRPGSKLAERMDYYIAPEEREMDFLKIRKPEEIKVCDPACGSGHMLTYAFDLLYGIYEEEGYDPAQIPVLILANNLTGIEIDDRASALAAFALAMKAAAKLGRRRFLRMEVKPDIVVLKNVTFTPAEIQDVAAVVGKDLFTDELRETLGQFEQAKNFGSLIVPKLRDPAETLRVVEARDFGSDLLLKEVQARVVAVLRMAEALSPKYHVVVANPPYMNSAGMNDRLKSWINREFSDFRNDAMTCFMKRSSTLCRLDGTWGMINLPSWMFLTTFHASRHWLVNEQTISTLLQLGRGIFGSDFGSVAFVARNRPAAAEDVGIYRRLFDKHVNVRSPEQIEALFLDVNQGRFVFRQRDFKKIPNEPLVYWVSDAVVTCFNFPKVGDIAEGEGKNVTADNNRFLRYGWEVEIKKFGRGGDWLPYSKGGPFRKWAGNFEFLVNWSPYAREFYRKNSSSRLIDKKFWYRPGITWTDITSGGAGFRKLPPDTTYDTTGISFFLPLDNGIYSTLATLNSKPCLSFLPMINPTLHANLIDVKGLPLPPAPARAEEIGRRLCAHGQYDWDAYETSWDFTTLQVLSPEYRDETLEATYATLRAHWQSMTDEMQRLEEENNRIFIDAYGLQDELTPEVPLNEITLTCNPAYRYSLKGAEADRETRLRGDTMAEFLSYAVGCMFGRYSLDAPGLILANQGDTLADYLSRVPEPSFLPDEDNVIPVLDGDWFADDLADRFRKFLRVTFGEEHFAKNLAFIEEALGKDIRRYFLRDFYDDHVRRYKKRPIYWMFSSPKGSFNALIYMHRYRADTVGVVLNGYLREYRSKLAAHRAQLETVSISTDAGQGEKTKALKEIERLGTVIEELDAYERDVLYPLATQRVEIDLDDGVKANYAKFGAALKPIKGLFAEEE
jgi:methylase of polypeptide subunit release factors